MAETTTSNVHAEDLVPVRSRISWGAILAGAMVALAIFYLLNLLGVAIGISVAGNVASQERLGIGAAIWATVVTLIALFLGGWVASQLAVGENKLEAAIYGVILWGTVFTLFLMLIASGIRLGFTGLVALSSNPEVTARADRELGAAAAEEKGSTSAQAKRETLKEKAKRTGADLHEAATSPHAVQAAWWSFGGILLSMIASVLGAVAGAGPTLVLRRVFVRQTGPLARQTVPAVRT